MFTEATPELIIEAYRQGIFPMAERKDSKFYDFYRPEKRGQLSIDTLHIPRKLRKTVRKFPFKVTINTAFKRVIEFCAEEKEGREETWINAPIRKVFIELHERGHAHSVECWKGRKLAGGLYGLALGRVFCGESMFSREQDASKIALVHLIARLWTADFSVLDTQFVNPHLEQFGAFEISQNAYEKVIAKEMKKKADFTLSDYEDSQEAEEDMVLNFLEELSEKEA